MTPDVEELVRRDVLSRPRKIEVLRRWEQDARDLQVAADENMAGDDSASLLQRIHEALRALGADPDPDRGAPTKHGGGE
jgi:hypothetical protein